MSSPQDKSNSASATSKGESLPLCPPCSPSFEALCLEQREVFNHLRSAAACLNLISNSRTVTPPLYTWSSVEKKPKAEWWHATFSELGTSTVSWPAYYAEQMHHAEMHLTNSGFTCYGCMWKERQHFLMEILVLGGSFMRFAVETLELEKQRKDKEVEEWELIGGVDDEEGWEAIDDEEIWNLSPIERFLEDAKNDMMILRKSYELQNGKLQELLTRFGIDLL